DLRQIVVGIRDDSALSSLDLEQLPYDAREIVFGVARQQERSGAVLRVGVDAEIHADAQLSRAANDWQDLIEIVVLDDGVEANVVDATSTHGRNRRHDL